MRAETNRWLVLAIVCVLDVEPATTSPSVSGAVMLAAAIPILWVTVRTGDVAAIQAQAERGVQVQEAAA
jgi:hypothetical protein